MKHFVQFIFSVILLASAASAFAQFNYISPMPGSKMKNRQTTIILKNGGFIDPSSLKNNLVSITGTKSGLHTARIVLSDDKKTICVYPQPIFEGGETVMVNVADGFKRTDGTLIHGTSFQFETHTDHPAQPQATDDADTRLLCNSIVPYTVTSSAGAYPGDVFYYNFWSSISSCWGRTILSNAGDSVYVNFNNTKGLGFTVNKNGYITYHDGNSRVWYMADSGYNVIDTFQMGNGYFADEHEFQIYPNGYYLMLALDTEFYQNLTSLYSVQPPDTIYGHDSVNVIGNVVQELDPSGNVIFEWNSFDHYTYQDAMFWVISTAVNLGTGSWFDWFHANALDLDGDTAILISSRHHSEVAKVSLNTGDFIWRMGGKNNQFHFLHDSLDLFVHPVAHDTFYFSGQHDVRLLPNGHLTMFNNDNMLSTNMSLTPIESSAKEYALDEVNKTATLVWHFYHPLVNNFVLNAQAMGSVQRLPNGNTFIDWGLIGANQHYDIMPKMTEVDSLGNIVWEFTWPFDNVNYYATYRAAKIAWDRCNLIPDSSLTLDSVGVHAAILSWGTHSKITGYILQYRPCNDSNWISVPLDTNYFLLQGLQQNTCYKWRVQSICQIYGDTSAGGVTHQFTTNLGLEISLLENPLASFDLYPNPASGNVEIKFTISTNLQTEFTIYNLLGGIVKHEILSSHTGTNRVMIDLGNLAAGAYNVELNAGNQTLHRRLVVD